MRTIHLRALAAIESELLAIKPNPATLAAMTKRWEAMTPKQRKAEIDRLTKITVEKGDPLP